MTRLGACLGCGTLVSPGPRCYDCRRAAEKRYDGTRPAHHALYRSHAWRVLSEKVRRAGSRCVWCLKPLPFRQRIADHVEPIEKRPELALEETNVVVACASCNTRRGRNWKLPDPDAPSSPVSVGARMADILEGAER
jgi:hypothetical protein